MAQITSGPVGILPGQNMFETDSTRQGILDARESFVRMANVIFSRTAIAVERPDAVAALNATTPITQYLMWHQNIGEQHIEPLPASSEYDEVVYSIEERDSLLKIPSFAESLSRASKKVLVNGLASDIPQWSVWKAVAPLGGIEDNTDPEEVFSLAKTYDYPEDPEDGPLTMQQRNLLILDDDRFSTGARVWVQGDSNTGGFWTIWEYAPGNAAADEYGFILVQTQNYRTTDFWEYIDWYAEGYTVTNPPVVRYADAAARNAAENPNPNTKFVRLDNDGSNHWVWTVFSDGAWNIVARERGTIRLSERLYASDREMLFDPTLPPPTYEKLKRVFNREGSWELRVIIDAMRESGIFTELEINEVFFSMLHFVHAQQDQVSWAFKTSFLNIGGYDESLRPVPVQPVDNTQNLLDYIEEVKPYRVKTRDFTRTVAPDIDVVPLRVTDFDLPPYYDPETGKYRILSLANTVDLEIIKTTQPWKDWYDNYQNPVIDPEQWEPNTFNPVRHMEIEFHYDRVDHMPLIAEEFFTYHAGEELRFDTMESLDNRLIEVFINGEKIRGAYASGTGNALFLYTTPPDNAEIKLVIRQGLSFFLAADRIQRFYNPVHAEKNIRAMLGLLPKNVIDGGSLADVEDDYEARVVFGSNAGGQEVINSYGLADPIHNGDRPEELVVVGSSESIAIHVNDENGNSFVMASAVPAMDLMVPKETGDYDARSLNEIAHDVGVIGGQLPTTIISVETVDVDAIKAAVASVMDVSLVIIRKLKNGVKWESTTQYRKGDVVQWTNGQLYIATSNTVPVGTLPNTLTHWVSRGKPTSLISTSTIIDVPQLLTALASYNAKIHKEIGQTPIFVQRSDGWEFVKAEGPVGDLVNDLEFDSTEIVYTGSAITPPTYQKAAKTKKKAKVLENGDIEKIIDKPGVVWINDERIEFFDYEETAPGEHTLRQLRRGTHGTPIGNEQRAINRVSSGQVNIPDTSFAMGNGQQVDFILEGDFADTNGLDVVIYDALKTENGEPIIFDYYSGYDVYIPQRKDFDYKSKLVNGDIVVTFTKPPANNAKVIIGKSDVAIHKAGSPVVDGRKLYEIRPDNNLGGMTHY